MEQDVYGKGAPLHLDHSLHLISNIFGWLKIDYGDGHLHLIQNRTRTNFYKGLAFIPCPFVVQMNGRQKPGLLKSNPSS